MTVDAKLLASAYGIEKLNFKIMSDSGDSVSTFRPLLEFLLVARTAELVRPGARRVDFGRRESMIKVNAGLWPGGLENLKNFPRRSHRPKHGRQQSDSDDAPGDSLLV